MKAILFDLDDTILIDDPATRATFETVSQFAATLVEVDVAKLTGAALERCLILWQQGVMHPFCHSIGIHAYECMWGNFSGPDPQYEKLHAWCPGYRIEVWTQALQAAGFENADLARQLAELYPRERRQRLDLMPDALEIVRSLRINHKVALLTNGSPSLQREKINSCQLESEFDAITISGELGIGKPKPEIFFATAEKLGVTPAECVMIGNSLERDIAGGNGAGMPTVHLQIPGAREEGTAIPTATIHALKELPNVLARLNATM